MCGIVGYFSTNDKVMGLQARKAALIELVIVNTLRGFDSTGYFAVDDEAEASYYKNAVSGWDFFDMKRTRAVLAKMEDFKAIVFHNRHATVGGINHKTAHPFDFEKIVGCHNGTLSGYSSLAKDHYPVDSQYLFAGINENGAVETLKKADGPIAMMYYNKETKKLCVYRNEDRPLAYAKLKDENTFFYASEKDMLQWILNRNKLETSIITEVPANVLFEININDHKDITQTKVQYVAPKPVPYVYRGPQRQRNEYGSEHDYEDALWPTQRQWVPIKESPAVLTSKADPAGYKVGDKIIAEISAAHSGTGGRYIAEGQLMGADFARITLQSISESDYKIMMPYLQKESFLLYVNIMSINNVNDHKNKWILASPYKPIGNYAKPKAQKRMLEQFCNDFADTKTVLDVAEDVFEPDDTKKFCKGPGGNMLTEKEFKEHTRYGCAICGDPLHAKDDLDWDAFPEPAHKPCVDAYDTEQALRKKATAMNSKPLLTLPNPKTSDMKQLVDDVKTNTVH